MQIMKCKWCIENLITSNWDFPFDEIIIEEEFKKESLPYSMAQRNLLFYPRTVSN